MKSSRAVLSEDLSGCYAEASQAVRPQDSWADRLLGIKPARLLDIKTARLLDIKTARLLD